MNGNKGLKTVKGCRNGEKVNNMERKDNKSKGSAFTRNLLWKKEFLLEDPNGNFRKREVRVM
jgi:hypothetical protein